MSAADGAIPTGCQRPTCLGNTVDYPSDPSTASLPKCDLPGWFLCLVEFIRLEECLDAQSVDETQGYQKIPYVT